MKLFTFNSITYTVPVVGAEKVEVKHNGRKLMIDAVDHVRVAANVIHNFPKLVADSLLAERKARRPDSVLDDTDGAEDDSLEADDADTADTSQATIDLAVADALGVAAAEHKIALDLAVKTAVETATAEAAAKAAKLAAKTPPKVPDPLA